MRSATRRTTRSSRRSWRSGPTTMSRGTTIRSRRAQNCSRTYTEGMKRVALLGATGSIGRQAIEIIEAHPELELCAAASATTSLDGVDAPLKQVGGNLVELLERAQPDVVLNAVVGFAGIHATLWALD